MNVATRPKSATKRKVWCMCMYKYSHSGNVVPIVRQQSVNEEGYERWSGRVAVVYNDQAKASFVDKPDCLQITRKQQISTQRHNRNAHRAAEIHLPTSFMLWRQPACWQQKSLCHLKNENYILCKQACLPHDDEALILHQHTVQQLLHWAR